MSGDGRVEPPATGSELDTLNGFLEYLRGTIAHKTAGLDAMALAKDIEELLSRFPNAQVNPDEQRRFRAAIYKPLLGLPPEERARAVDLVRKLLLAEGDE